MKLFTLTFITLALLVGCKPELDFRSMSMAEIRRARPDLFVIGASCHPSFLGEDGGNECTVFVTSHPPISVRCEGVICTCTDYVRSRGLKYDFDTTRWKLVPIAQPADLPSQDH